MTITVTPAEAEEGTTGGTTITNTASVEATEDDSDDTNNSATEPTVVNRQADTLVTGDGSSDSVLVGRPLTYTLVVTNNGPSQATKLVLTDSLPADITFGSVVTSQGSCDQAAGTVTCNLGKLDSSSTATIIIVVTPTPAAGGTTIINTVSVTSDVDDFTLENNNFEEKTVVIRNADLSVTKRDAPDPVAAGDTLTYIVTVASNGPSLATNVTLTDILPAAVIFGSATPSQGHCDQTSGIVTCILGAITSGASATATITVAPTGSTTITNTVSVTGDELDPVSVNNSASQSTAVTPKADLSVSKADNPDPVAAGDRLTYTFTVRNSGPSDATGVTLTDLLPAGVSFQSATSSQGSCVATSAVTCTLGTLSSGDNTTVTIVVTPNSAGDITNTASVTADQGDPDLGNNTASVTTTVNPSGPGPLPPPGPPVSPLPVSDLVLTKTHAPDPVLLGGNVTYTLTAVNKGPSIATGVTLTDSLPGIVSFVSSTASQGNCSEAGGIVTCIIGALNSKDNATVTIVVRPRRVGTIANTATLTSKGSDPDLGDNIALQTTTVNPASNLRLTKGDSPDLILVGEELTYTLFVTNSGPSDALDVTLTDTLPEGVSFVSASRDCTEAGGKVTCNLRTLPRGESVTVTIVVTPNLAGSLINIASVTSSSTDPRPGDNITIEFTTVSTVADLRLTKAESSDPVLLGNNLIYTVTITNNGPSDVTGVTLRDTVPEGLTFLSASAGCTEAGGTVTCDLGNLASGARAAVSIQVSVETAPTGTLRNTVSVTGNGFEPRTASETTTVSPAADLSVTKAGSPELMLLGSNLTYTIRVANKGPSTATGVTLTDTLPEGVSFVSVSEGCAEAGGTVTCNLSDLAPGDNASVTIVVTPSSTGNLIDTSIVKSSVADPHAGDNTAIKSTMVKPAADLRLTKAESSDPVSLGNNLTYTLIVTNSGPSDATGVTLSDTLPESVTFLSASAGCAEAGGTVTCGLGTLARGDSATATIIVTSTTAGTIANTASVTANETDPNTGDNDATVLSHLRLPDTLVSELPITGPVRTPTPVPTPTVTPTTLQPAMTPTPIPAPTPTVTPTTLQPAMTPTPTPAPTPTPGLPPSGDGRPSYLIPLLAMAGIAIVSTFIFFLARRRKKKREEEEQEEQDNS